MRATWLVVVALAACGRLGFDSPTSLGDAPPDGDGDRDGDGVPDGTDNCPTVANADQANEDGDRFGDACDPCPPVADADPIADQDGDGVADACDPHPGVGGDHLALFEGFNGTSVPTRFTADGSWSVANGQLAVVSALSTSGSLLTAIPLATSETVSADVELDQLFGTGVVRVFGAVTQEDVVVGRGVTCSLVRDSGNSNELEIGDGNGGGPLAATTTGLLEMGTRTILVLRRDGTSYTCDGVGMMVASPSPFVSSMPKQGLRTTGISAHVRWLMIVSN